MTRTPDPIITNKGYPPQTGLFRQIYVPISPICADFVRVSKPVAVHMYIGPKRCWSSTPALTKTMLEHRMADNIPTPTRGAIQTAKGEIPDWVEPSTGKHMGFHDDSRMVAAFYMPDGTLFSVTDTETGKEIWPPKIATAYIGRRARGFVYFIRAQGGPIKIGHALDVKARLNSLQTANPYPLELLASVEGGQPKERQYHIRFSEHRSIGEWFHPHPDILAEIERLKELSA